MKFLFVFILVCVCQYAHSAHSSHKCLQIEEDAEPVYCVSITFLLGSAHEFNGKLVRINGFLNLEFEGTAIYVHKEDFEKSLFENGVWVNVNSEEFESVNKSYVTLVGRFHSGRGGHRGGWSGELTEVKTKGKF